MFQESVIKKILRIIAYTAVALAAVGFLLFLIGKPKKDIAWGITFSSIRAEELGFNPPQLLARILDDIRAKKVRLPAYWSDLETEQGKFDFSKIESLLSETDKRNAEVILVIGKKQPRWPECHQPEWFNELNSDEQYQAVLNMTAETVKHLQAHQSIVAWQVENEPFFQYGPSCPVTDKNLYKHQISIVEQLDDKPTIVTDSGEKGIWVNSAWSGANILGTTMYREVYHDKKGKYLTYKLPWWTYNIKAGLVKLITGTDEVIGVELQAEPWLIVSNPNGTPPDEQLKHMNPDIFRNNIEYATKVGLPENYLWGAEWWYWMQQKHNDSSMVNAAKTFFNNQ